MKQIINSLLVAASFVTSASLVHGASDKAATTAPERDSKQAARLNWWREAKFGLFIHWRLYSVAAGEYNGKLIPKTGEWIMWNAKIPAKDYEKFATGLTGNPPRIIT